MTQISFCHAFAGCLANHAPRDFRNCLVEPVDVADADCQIDAVMVGRCEDCSRGSQ